jgi:uncharacterized membrane protein YfcA
MGDKINGIFELAAAFFVYLHIRKLKEDRAVKGLSIISVVFFSSWSVFNLAFYPINSLLWSFWAGIPVFLANIYYVYLLIKYNKKIT